MTARACRVHPSPLCRLAAMLAVPAVAGCAGGPATRVSGDVPPSSRTIIFQLDSSVNGKFVYVTNTSTHTVRITSIHLLACLNVRQPCDVNTPLKVDVGPGQRRMVYTIEPENGDRPFQFGWYWSWHMLDGSSAIPPAGEPEARAASCPAAGPADPRDTTVYTEGSLTARPERVAGPSPRYPTDLRAAKSRGRVLVQLIVGVDGLPEPRSVRVVFSTDSAFDAPAADAIRASRWCSGRIGNRPVRVLVQQPVNFELTP
jgi:hypothetical protein